VRRRHIGVIVTTCAVLVAILLILAALETNDFVRIALPGYLTGIGTIGLAATTVWLIKREDDDRRTRDIQDAAAAELMKREQARHVRISLPGERGTVHEPGSDRGTAAYQAFLVNDSDDVISGVRVVFGITPADTVLATIDESPRSAARVMPGEQVVANVTYQLKFDPDTRQPVAHEVTSECNFIDAAGYRWARDADHVLTERPAS